MNKIIFLDIDGTIRDSDGSIPESTVQAIQKARENGHKVCICTGRPYFQIEKRILDIGFDGVISGSGSYVLYEGKCICHKSFTLLTSINLCNYLLENQCVIELQTYEKTYLLESEVGAFRAVEEGIKEKLGGKSRETADDPEIIKSVMDVVDVEKILFFSNQLSDEEIRKKWGKFLYILPLSIPSSERWGGEIAPLSVNKAEGIRMIMDEGQFSNSDVIAIGDSENDVEMLAFASVGVAMGNATEKAKEVADMIKIPLREDGVKKTFEELGLI